MDTRGRPKKRIKKRTVVFELIPYELDGSTLQELSKDFADFSLKYPGCILDWDSGDFEGSGACFRGVCVEEETDEQYAARIAQKKAKAEKSEARKRSIEMSKLQKIQAKLAGLGVKVTIEEVKPEVKKVLAPVNAGPVRKFDFENV